MESKFKVIYFKSIQLVAVILVSLLILTLFYKLGKYLLLSENKF